MQLCSQEHHWAWVVGFTIKCGKIWCVWLPETYSSVTSVLKTSLEVQSTYKTLLVLSVFYYCLGRDSLLNIFNLSLGLSGTPPRCSFCLYPHYIDLRQGQPKFQEFHFVFFLTSYRKHASWCRALAIRARGTPAWGNEATMLEPLHHSHHCSLLFITHMLAWFSAHVRI